MERYRLLGIEHDGRESASARVVSREPNKWGVFPLHTFNSGDEVVLAADAQATIAALQADNRTYINERHEHVKQIEQLQSQLTQRTAELEAAQRKARLQREVEAALSSKVTEYEVELNGDPQNFYGRGRTVGLRALIAALPKVEGEILEQGDFAFVRYAHADGPLPEIPRCNQIALLQYRKKMKEY